MCSGPNFDRYAVSEGKPARGAGEFEWIECLRRIHGNRRSRRFPLRIGDDAAAWTPADGATTVLTVDAQVEGVHFRRDWLSWRDLGHRAVSASLSDLAAMGARPRCLLVSLVLDAQTDSRSFRDLQRGIAATARQYDVVVAGGNLSQGQLAVHVTALGECRPDRLLTRSGARVGDTIWVTGSPGLAALGVRYLSDSAKARRLTPRPLAPALRAYRRPTARVASALYLARYWRPSALIDVSDGLAADLGHVLRSSSGIRQRTLGAELRADALRALPKLSRAAQSAGVDVVSAALQGGEDYELLFTTSPIVREERKRHLFDARFKLALTAIGTVTSAPGTVVTETDGTCREIASGTGWDHFGARGRSPSKRH